MTMDIPSDDKKLVGMCFEIKTRIDELDDMKKMLIAEIQRRGLSGHIGAYKVKTDETTKYEYDQAQVDAAITAQPAFVEFFKHEWKADNRKINAMLAKNEQFAEAFKAVGRTEKKTAYTKIESTMEE